MLNEIKSKINLNQAALVKEEVAQAKNILLVTHKNPDGDAIGSIAAMAEYLESQNKNYIAFCLDGVPGDLEYLKYSHQIIADENELKKRDFDLVILLDCADANYSGIGNFLRQVKDKGIKLINIDHHPQSDFGHININNPRASATAEILYELFNVWHIKVSQDMATSLLAGILVDTGTFSNSATSQEVLTIAARLFSLGGRYRYINKQLYEHKDENALYLWSKVLSRLQKNDKLKVAYSLLFREDMQGMQPTAAEGITNFFNFLDGFKMVLVLKETFKGEIKVSLRALEEGVDVSKLARFFGGGGHVKAAGFSFKGSLEREGSYWKII